MSHRTTPVDARLHDYLVRVSVREPALLRQLREETAAMPEHNMQISPEQGQFMAMLVRLLGARRCIEVGTFTGYSSLAVMMALPDDAQMICLDISEDYTAVARRYWEEAGVAGRIDLRIGPALDALQGMVADRAHPRDVDFVFIDADKTGYDAYYESCLRLVRPGGLIAFDNTLWDGKVADPSVKDEDTRAIRALNEQLRGDDRVELSLVPIGDGLTLCRKR
jgi:O-methyltransferase